MWPAERRSNILDLLRENGRVTVDDLAERMASSRETIRRDLNHLSIQGHLRKFHGGAELPHVDGESSYHIRMTENVRAKRRIATRAARLFDRGATLFVDTGTTTVFFAEELAKADDISVITNSSVIASSLVMAESTNRVYVIGGQQSGDGTCTFGALAVEQISVFHAADVVLAVGALDISTGLTSYSVDEAEIARAMIRQAKTVTVLADSSKLERTALFEVCPLNRLD
ncbi:MAG: DeoR/GlpR transcriptional regulator, partial [Alphaproteobacteria bacterium]|nr:DeoR/GlpR transcriptional regulator [Alphaproteobacteria bacterium]